MQVEHKTEKGTILFVKVSDDSFGHWVNTIIKHHLNYHTPKLEGMSDIDCHTLELSGDDFVLIGLTSEVTEEQAKMIVDKMISSYQDYTDSKVVQTYSLFTALDSFKSLMKHLQINDSEKWIVLFKEN